ncbi:MAG: AAA family ATPase [Chloroflexi bacterium]|nr:AAA family ATPase [Chloroflexota bacterium]
MSSRVTDRVTQARRQRFVGRDVERALFVNALAASELPFQILYVCGPGGVGKTTLLREFTHLAEQAHISAHYVDARHFDPAPESFLAALGIDTPLQTLAQSSRRVILVDTYETLAPLDAWLREVFLPQVSDQVLLVLAGRDAPTPPWRADEGWSSLLRVIALRNLSPDESRVLLERRQVPAHQHNAVLDFTHGHPLALSLVADVFAQRPGLEFQPERAPDVIKTLLEQFAQKVPGPAHRAALEACVLVRLTTESLLSELLAMPDARELFDWLRGLSFVQAGPQGLFPHDLAREAMSADIRWRNPDWYRELHKRARNYYMRQLAQASGGDQPRVLADYIFLHRDNPVVRSLFQWQESASALADAMQPTDRDTILAMVTQHEGVASARIAAHWLARQPQGIVVFREPNKPPTGFLALVSLDRATPDDLKADPATRAAHEYLRKNAPLRAGEIATLFRFWMARDTYQSFSPIQSLIFIIIVRHYLTMPALAFTFIPCAQPDTWSAGFAYGDIARLPEADFTIGGKHFGVFGHDWRARPPMTWLALMAEREVGSGAPTATLPTQPLLVLSQEEFAAAVRDALREYAHADLLRTNPLLQSRLVVQRAALDAPNAARIAALQALLKESAESLQSAPRFAKMYRAVYHTYLKPAPTQEQAAEMLDLPFSTYRRHLKDGIDHILESLWQQEIGK